MPFGICRLTAEDIGSLNPGAFYGIRFSGFHLFHKHVGLNPAAETFYHGVVVGADTFLVQFLYEFFPVQFGKFGRTERVGGYAVGIDGDDVTARIVHVAGDRPEVIDSL